MVLLSLSTESKIENLFPSLYSFSLMGILSRNLVTLGILSPVCTMVQAAEQVGVITLPVLQGASQINYKQFYNVSIASNGLVISQV